MRLGTRSKVVVGAATFWPALWVMMFVLVGLLGVLYQRGRPETDVPMAFATVGALVYVVTIWTLVLLVPLLIVFHLVYLFLLPGMSAVAKALWAVALVAGSIVAMPVFFWIHILRAGPRPAAIVEPR